MMGDSGCDIIMLTWSHVTTLTTRRPPLPREEGVREVSPFKDCGQNRTRPPSIWENLSHNAREHANTHSIFPMCQVPKHKSVSNKQMSFTKPMQSLRTRCNFPKHSRQATVSYLPSLPPRLCQHLVVLQNTEELRLLPHMCKHMMI